MPTPIPTPAFDDAPRNSAGINMKWVAYILGRIDPMRSLAFWDGTEAEQHAAVQAVEQIMLLLIESE